MMSEWLFDSMPAQINACRSGRVYSIRRLKIHSYYI
nr:MAG TPA: hypothetical protein [Bacteriophage sp.]